MSAEVAEVWLMKEFNFGLMNFSYIREIIKDNVSN
jgi:hypothetical protein